VREVIINVHHFAELVLEYLKKNNNFGMRIEMSREEVLLDTGGGLKQAAWFFRQDSKPREDPFILHNVDVISTIDLELMAKSHLENRALATLAVQQRKTSRYLLFDPQLQLCGRQIEGSPKPELVKPAEKLEPLAFAGVHVISPRIFTLLTEEGVFPIVPAYLRLTGQGERITGFRADQYYWRDLGKPENITHAARDLEQGVFS